MTGIEIAGGFATIVALIGQFKTERKDAKDAKRDDYETFLEWLHYHQHQAIIDAIVKNGSLQLEITTLLRQDTQTILKEISKLDSAISKIASNIDEFRGLVHVFGTIPNVHRETLNLLPELVRKDWKKFCWLPRLGGDPELVMLEGKCESIECDEQFLEQDLDQLAELGYLVIGYMGSGEKTYALTRSAYKFVSSLEGS